MLERDEAGEPACYFVLPLRFALLHVAAIAAEDSGNVEFVHYWIPAGVTRVAAGAGRKFALRCGGLGRRCGGRRWGRLRPSGCWCWWFGFRTNVITRVRTGLWPCFGTRFRTIKWIGPDGFGAEGFGSQRLD